MGPCNEYVRVVKNIKRLKADTRDVDEIPPQKLFDIITWTLYSFSVRINPWDCWTNITDQCNAHKVHLRAKELAHNCLTWSGITSINFLTCFEWFYTDPTESWWQSQYNEGKLPTPRTPSFLASGRLLFRGNLTHFVSLQDNFAKTITITVLYFT